MPLDSALAQVLLLLGCAVVVVLLFLCLQPDPAQPVEAGDSLVLFGPPEALAEAEARLLR
ncbi:MAG: hypothetical protein KIT17_20875 [Rubrivivax sp.]|nr:hypothetical protein [Rubrivivax sp.]